MTMRQLIAAIAFFSTVSIIVAQDDARSLVARTPQAGTLTTKASHTYTVTADDDHFVHGVANQIDVDLVIRVLDPAGKEVAQFDTGGRGPEPFQFETDTNGTYQLIVAPFEDQSGRYTIQLGGVEAIATSPEGRIDQLIAAYDHDGTPGGIIAVIRQGELVFSRAFGTANIADSIPFSADTRTNIGSTSKQFTAFAILLLADQGKLSLDDDVRTHFPELPEFDHVITIRHLLTHTSGYREFINTLALGGRLIGSGDAIKTSEIIDIIQRQPELQNVPGAEWNYNNSGFGLLAMLVERISGDDFPTWMKANVFEPIGMHHTTVRGGAGTIIPLRAVGYVNEDKRGYREAVDIGASSGAGGIYSTAGDLALWIRNLGTGEHGGKDLIKIMAFGQVPTGGGSNYGFGLFVDEYRGLPRVHHGGADIAHRSMLIYYPTIDAGLITQSNNASFDGSISDKIADAFFDEHLTPRVAEESAEAADASDAEPAAFDAETLDAFVGRFSLDEAPQFILTFTREGDELVGQATGQPTIGLERTGERSFKVIGVDASITFNRGEDGEVNTIMLQQNGDHPGSRVVDEPWAPDAAQLTEYAGRYFSEELETFYTIVIEEDELVVQHRRLDDMKLQAASEHDFTGEFPIGTLKFTMDDTGAVTGLEVGNGRARGILFVKQ